MTNRELERLFQDSSELDPRPELKQTILARAEQVDLPPARTNQQDNRARASARVLFSPKRWIPVAACFVAVCGLFAGFGWGVAAEDYRTVYIDVNPSVALHLNRFERVSGVEYLNEDAKEALDGVKLKGRRAEDALDAVIDACDASGYINETAEVYISAVTDNKTNTSELLDKLETRATERHERKYGVNTTQFTKEEQEKAKDLDMSPGKYCLISDVLEADPDYTVDDLRDKPMHELKELKDQGGHKGNGNGNEAGKHDGLGNENENQNGLHGNLGNEEQDGKHQDPANENQNGLHGNLGNEEQDGKHEGPVNESQNSKHEGLGNENQNGKHEGPANESQNSKHEGLGNKNENVEHEVPDPDNGLGFENQNGCK